MAKATGKSTEKAATKSAGKKKPAKPKRSGAGRPTTHDATATRLLLPKDMHARVMEWATAGGLRYQEAMRQIVEAGLVAAKPKPPEGSRAVKCQRCGYEWVTVADRESTRCSKCKSMRAEDVG